jgi:hypothetical protein
MNLSTHPAPIIQLYPHAGLPVHEQGRSPCRHGLQPRPGSGVPAAEPLVFAHSPADQIPVDVSQGRDQPGRIEPPVIVHPTPDHRVDQIRQVLKVGTVPAVQPPPADLMTERFQRLVRRRRRETDKRAAIEFCSSPPDPSLMAHKSGSLLRERNTELIFCFIDAEKADFPITLMCAVLGVSRQGYYAWRARRAAPPSERQSETDVLRAAIESIHAVTGHRGSGWSCADGAGGSA